MSTPHGGDLTGVGRAFGRDPDTLLDFSANINLLGPPAAVSALLRAAADRPAMLAAYPDPYARELTAVLAERVAVAAECITIANGNAALLAASVCARSRHAGVLCRCRPSANMRARSPPPARR